MDQTPTCRAQSSTIIHAMCAGASRVGVAALVALLAGSSCTCPPCAVAAESAPTCAPLPVATAASAASAGGAAPQAAQAKGAREVLWDGELVARGQGWANCDKPAEGCKATLTAALNEGAGNSNGLKLQGQGAGWQGGGWNWFGWWPENAGTDVSSYHDLTFALKVTGGAPDKLPKADRITLALGCSLAKKTSLEVPLAKHAANVIDGQWHDVSIPLQEFFSGKGAECDARVVWELRVNVWSDTPVQFELVLDNLALARSW